MGMEKSGPIAMDCVRNGCFRWWSYLPARIAAHDVYSWRSWINLWRISCRNGTMASHLSNLREIFSRARFTICTTRGFHSWRGSLLLLFEAYLLLKKKKGDETTAVVFFPLLFKPSLFIFISIIFDSFVGENGGCCASPLPCPSFLKKNAKVLWILHLHRMEILYFCRNRCKD